VSVSALLETWPIYVRAILDMDMGKSGQSRVIDIGSDSVRSRINPKKGNIDSVRRLKSDTKASYGFSFLTQFRSTDTAYL